MRVKKTKKVSFYQPVIVKILIEKEAKKCTCVHFSTSFFCFEMLLFIYRCSRRHIVREPHVGPDSGPVAYGDTAEYGGV